MREGDDCWLVPIRFWEPNDYQPQRCRFISQTKASQPGAFDAYVFHAGYGHNVYVRGDLLHPSFFQARAAQIRMSVADAERRRREFDEWWAKNREKIFAAALHIKTDPAE